MTVRELIDELENFNDEMEVFIYDDDLNKPIVSVDDTVTMNPNQADDKRIVILELK